ncbi:MAG: hypothetical protein KGI25_10290 [Thaumarchaeota archaeon]|nr:hypothetical protein [Nitrososphaerota archaeon]
MPGLGTAATTLITTKGLFVGDGITSALEFGAGITPWFRLYVGPYVPPPVKYVAAAGSRVYESSQDIFKEVDEHGKQIGAQQPAPFGEVNPATGKRLDHQEGAEAWYVVPREREKEFFGEATRDINIKVVFRDTTYEKTYKVRERNAGRIIEVINFTNTTRARISATISRIKRVTTRALVEVRNFKLVRRRNKY